MHIRHAEEEIKRRERKRRETDTQDFPGTRKVKDQNDREKGRD